jgi:hypothetical protein
MAPFCSFGVAHGGEKTAHQYPRLWFSSEGLRLLGWYGLCQSQPPVKKSA